MLPLLHRHVRTSDSILHIGCGTSSLTAELYDTGYGSIVNCDTSPAAIDACTQIYSRERPGLSFAVMDALDLQFNAGTFGVVLDKGCLDAVSCHLIDGEARAARMLREVHRVLHPGGLFLLVTSMSSELSRGYFEAGRSSLFTLISQYTLKSKKEEAGVGEGEGEGTDGGGGGGGGGGDQNENYMFVLVASEGSGSVAAQGER
jgi:SAM-dependent methyltransferase